MTLLSHNEPLITHDLGKVLVNTSLAMKDLGVFLHRLETHLIAGDARGTASPADQSSLQMIDLLAQSITEIAALLERLEDSIAVPVMINHETVIEPIRLERLRALIGEGTTGEIYHASSLGAGNVALFD